VSSRSTNFQSVSLPSLTLVQVSDQPANMSMTPNSCCIFTTRTLSILSIDFSSFFFRSFQVFPLTLCPRVVAFLPDSHTTNSSATRPVAAGDQGGTTPTRLHSIVTTSTKNSRTVVTRMAWLQRPERSACSDQNGLLLKARSVPRSIKQLRMGDGPVRVIHRASCVAEGPRRKGTTPRKK
jgi:hypothetical protein